MNRRHVLQTLAVISAGSPTLVAVGESHNSRLAATASRNLSETLRESKELCIDLLGRLDRVESRLHLVAGSNSKTYNAATQALQELSVLLEQTEARVLDTEVRAVALLQACVDSLRRVENPVMVLCEKGLLPRPVVDSSFAVFGQARRLLSGLPAV